MSVVERALKRLRANGAETPTVRRERLARVAPTGRVDTTGVWTQMVRDIESRPHIEFNLDVLGRAGLYAPQNSRLADEYRIIKQPLLKKAVSETGVPHARNNLVMVASALPGEGKTFTSVNLALSLAKEKDWSVMLIDTDCRNPALTRLLGANDEPGLLDVLRDPEAELESYVMATNIDSLFVLPVGQISDNATELLASARMDAICERLASVGGKWIVIFDSSPILLTTESIVLSEQVGQITLVVNANKTPQSAVLEAIEKLSDEKSIGLVLNRADRGGEVLGYGSYQAYGQRAEP